MDLVGAAGRFRLFLDTLLTGRLVLEYRRELEEMRVQRDYFRGRAERFELMLTELRARRVAPVEKEPRTPHAAGRKSWKQIQKEHREKMEQQAREAHARKDLSASLTPANPKIQ
jgi:hypothetical protein